MSLFNHGSELLSVLSVGLGPGLLVKLALNYLTPFVVANIGLLSRTPEEPG